MSSVENHATFAPQSAEEEACLHAMQLCSCSVLPMTLKAAIELELLEIIKRAGPNAFVSSAEVASELPTKNPQAPVMVDRIMRLLASYNILMCKLEMSEEGKMVRKYGAAPVVQFLTKDEDGVSFAALGLVTQDKVVMESWYHLKDAILDGGIPFDKAYGMGRFEYHGIDLRFNKLFNEAMRHHSMIITKNILEIYKGFEDIKTLVDVGGGVGGTIKMIIQKHPHLKGINLDLPHVISEAQPIPGVEHVGGDMFESVPCGDAIFIKSILHNWSDDHCTKLLKNCYKALPDTAKVILLEISLPMYPEPTPIVQTMIHWDHIMLAHFHGGKERTLGEIDALAKNMGFKGTKVVCRYAIFSIVEIYKGRMLQDEKVTNHESLRLETIENRGRNQRKDDPQAAHPSVCPC